MTCCVQVFQGKVKSPAPATAPAGSSRFFASDAGGDRPPTPAAAASASSPSPFNTKKFQRGQVLSFSCFSTPQTSYFPIVHASPSWQVVPFNLHGKHRDRRGFKHPGDSAADDTAQTSDFPDGVFLPQKDRSQLLDMMKGQWEQYNNEYQKLTLSLHNLHTIERVKRRQELENQLASLEKSIKTMQRPFVFLQVGRAACVLLERCCSSGGASVDFACCRSPVASE